LRVTLVNTFDKGGAANACLRLNQGLNKLGVSSSVLVKHATIRKSGLNAFRSPGAQLSFHGKLVQKANRILKEFYIRPSNPNKKGNSFLRKRSKRLEIFSYPTSTLDITTDENYKTADIINLHWVAQFLDYPTFFIKNDKPIVWTLHDMNPFTGGEHYNEWYGDIGPDGKPTKRVLTDLEKTEFQKVLKLKERVFERVENLHIVSLSSWMTQEIKKSKLFRKFPVTEIPNGIDESIFNIRDRHYSRALLGIQEEKKVVLFVADSITNNRKGFIYLRKAIEQIDHNDVILCTVGKKSSDIEQNQNLLELGSVSDERLMSAVYSAADVFVIPSLMDNLPNTVLESLMCGTPVIGFPIGGIPDMVQNGVNGYLTDEISVLSLKKTIDKFLANPDAFDRHQIRNIAVQKYALEVQAKAYKELFQNILN
jgi:glycosyltransferase involved in cell wall biosynthesis